MRKLLMATAILALGVVAYGKEEASAPVRVRAEIVEGNITISDIDGRPILLDFKKIAKNRETDANAFVDYKIEYNGTYNTIQGQTMNLVLGKSNTADTSDDVILTNLDSSLTQNNTMTANLKLDKYSLTLPSEEPTNKVIHTGRINGTLKATEWSGSKEAGVYEGQTELKVTIGA